MATELVVKKSGGKSAAVNLTDAGLVAAAATMEFNNDGQSMLLVQMGATPCNLTISSPACTHGRSASHVIALAASKLYLLGPWPPEYNDPSQNNRVQIAFSAITSILAAVVRTLDTGN